MHPHRQWAWWFSAGVVLAVAVVARFVAPSALWLDEAQSVAISRLPVPQLFAALRQDGSPPLYYLLLHGWMAVFGTGTAAVRALSGVLSVLALPLAWRVTRQLAGPRVAWVLLFLLACSPFALRYAGETRMYSLVVLLTVLGAMAVRWAVRSGGPLPVVSVGAVTGALLLTHLWSFHLVAVVGALALAEYRRHRSAARRILLGLWLGLLAFLPWVPSLLVQIRHTGTPWAVQAGASIWPIALDAWQGGAGPAAWLLGIALVLLVALGALAEPIGPRRPEPRVVLRLRPTRSRGRLLALTLGTLTVGGLISVLTGSSVSGRYTSVAFLPFLLLAAFGVAAVPGRRARVLVLTVVVGLGLGVGAPAVLAPRTQAPQVARALSAAAPGDVVVFCPDQLGPAVSRLAPPGLELVGYPDLRPADRVDWTDYARRNTAVPSATVAERVLERATGAGIWVVTSDDYRVPSTERCHDLVRALAAVRGSPLSVVARRPHVFENERLQYFARDGQAEPAQLPGRPR